MQFSIIVAATKSSMGIGINGNLPWKLPGDMAFFKMKTVTAFPLKTNAVIMGRKTWQSLSRPLVGRLNVVISRNPNIRKELNIPSTVIVVDSLESALDVVTTECNIGDIFVIGGESIYREAIQSFYCSKIYLTQIDADISGLDTFFPVISLEDFVQTTFSQPVTENDTVYYFTEYDRIVT